MQIEGWLSQPHGLKGGHQHVPAAERILCTIQHGQEPFQGTQIGWVGNCREYMCFSEPLKAFRIVVWGEQGRGWQKEPKVDKAQVEGAVGSDATAVWPESDR